MVSTSPKMPELSKSGKWDWGGLTDEWNSGKEEEFFTEKFQILQLQAEDECPE